MVMNFAHLKKEMMVKGKNEGEGKAGEESKTQEEQGQSQQQHYPARKTDPQEQRPKQNPHTASRGFSRSSTLLANSELGDYATPQDVWCYGCVNASVDAPGTVEESWLCMQRKKTGEDVCAVALDDQEFVYKQIRLSYLVGDCPLVKKGEAHREVKINDG